MQNKIYVIFINWFELTAFIKKGVGKFVKLMLLQGF